jgi:hypothetical protein
VEIGKIKVQDQPRQKMRETSSQPITKPVVVVHTCHSNHSGSINRSLGINSKPCSKNNYSKKDWYHGSNCRALA